MRRTTLAHLGALLAVFLLLAATLLYAARPDGSTYVSPAAEWPSAPTAGAPLPPMAPPMAGSRG